MRGIIIESFGGPEQLDFREDLPDPIPDDGEVLVSVGAVGVNFTDVYQREGIYPRPLPFTPGSEGAGVIRDLGPGVAGGPDGWSVGDRVAWCNAPDSYAELVAVPADSLVAIPDSIPDDVAASILLQGLTAHFLVHDVGRLCPGNTVLLTAGAGGVGLLLTQLAVAAGARVATIVSSDEKAALSRDAGAELVLHYDDDVPARIRDWTGDRGADDPGVDVVFDGVGKATFDVSLQCARVRGLVALFGAASGAVPPMDPQQLNQHGSLFLTRPHLRHFIRDRAELSHRAGEVLSRIADGTLRVRVGDRFPLDDAAGAHRALQSRATTGSLVLLP
ncbi:quinone oxidoreductase family protein [Corynebacterium xerosis]|uniref:Quinone oxidoreductase n=1 Tax=Corynebacterium xerosis TaxID=1725 RepID=A0A7X9SU98_9CORY|nr:quinone oxidoreductase [Corynebacterium xerosis]NMF08154.1 quinone oxidoreductase [Corynebacterium xerosis]